MLPNPENNARLAEIGAKKPGGGVPFPHWRDTAQILAWKEDSFACT